MGRKFFGTDGIRGRTNCAPMTAEIALRVGQAAGTHFLRGDHRHRVVIGKDTRLSGYMMESAMVAGFTSVGMDVVLLGPMPTPAVAMLTQRIARRPGRDDLAPATIRSRTMASSCSAPTATSCPTRTSWRSRRCSRASRRWSTRPQIGRAQADRRCARALHPLRQVDLARPYPARRAQDRASIAPMAPPTRSRPRRCGSWAPK